MNDTLTAQIREHMAVVGSDGVFVGTVDRVQGDYIKLTQRDDDDQEHHYIDLPWVAHVDDKVHLSRTGAQAKRDWGHEF
jgi:hypothetical protein